VFSELHNHRGYPESELSLVSAEQLKHHITAAGHLLFIFMTKSQHGIKGINTSAWKAA